METTTTTSTSMSVEFTRHVRAAWTRWTQRNGQSGALSNLTSAELQTQYELLAAGVAAPLTDDQVQSIWRDEQEGGGETIWTLLLPLQEQYDEDRERVHFLLVVVAELLTLGGEALILGAGVRGTARALWLVETLVMPLIKSRAYQRLHAIALVLVERLVAISSDRVAMLLSQRVFEALMAESQTSQADDRQDGELHPEEYMSYVSLCRVFQIVLESTEAFVRVAELNEQIQSVCLLAIEKFDRQPRFLRAVSVHLMPALVDSAPATIEILISTAITTWENSASVAAVTAAGSKMRASSRPAQGAFTGSQVSNLLYMLCLLLPKDPTLIRENGLQRLIAFALSHQDPLLRKQALHLLKISFSHYAMESAATTTRNSGSGEPQSSKQLEIWQSFILASDVIQLHHEPHLLEQVWPQVDHLLQLLLLVLEQREQDEQDERASEASSTTSSSASYSMRRPSSSSTASSPPTSFSMRSSSAATPVWPVQFTFPWIQSLLMRVFRHENPVVRRMFLSNFMQTCVDQLNKPEWSVSTTTAASAVLRADSFISDPRFEAFVFQRVLSAMNDPLMYKSSRREPFQALITQFFASLLAFKLVHLPHTTDGDSASPATPGLINTFLRSACDAVFGMGCDVHSPEAIISSLQAFEDPALQRIVAANPQVVDSLDAASFEKVRFMLEVYVLRSFPLSMRTKLLQSLQHALTRGFTRHEQLPVESLARTLSIFPASHLALDHSAAVREIRTWLRASDAFRVALSTGIKKYLATARASTSVETGALPASDLTASQLSRLLLFTADPEQLDGGSRLVVQQPVTDLVGDVSLFDQPKLEKLLILLGTFEQELHELGAAVFTGVGLVSRGDYDDASLVFRPKLFYGAHGLSCVSLFQAALRRADQWLLAASSRAYVSTSANTERSVATDELEGDQMQYEQDVLGACAVLTTQLATVAMEEDGDIELIQLLNAFCERIKAFVSATATTQQLDAKQQLQDQAVALRFLAVVSSQPLAIDAVEALECTSLLPLLLQLEASRRGTNSSRHVSECLFLFAASKWRVIHNVVAASAYVATPVLRAVFDQCVDALFSAGSDPELLTDMVQVLSIAFARLGHALVENEEGDHERLNEVFQEIWNAYGHAKPKPDALTRAVVYCMFQPSFLRRRALVEGKHALMKQWFHKVVSFGEHYRPNVLFHLSCRLAQIWRVEPRAALPFVDEIVELLLYREPIIADKQKSQTLADVQMTSDVALAAAFLASDNNMASKTNKTTKNKSVKSALSAKDRFVRFVILSFLDELNIDGKPTTDDGSSTSSGDERDLLDGVLRKLLEMNFGDDLHKQQMLNSDGFGRRLRSWQALTVLSKHITSHNVAPLSELIWRAFAATQLPMIRFYMEVLGMRLAMRFPQVTIQRHVLPLLRNFNLTPQVGAAVLLVAGFFINHTMLSDSSSMDNGDQAALARSLMEALLPWLNASHGHTRVMVQFLLGVLLPRYLHVLESSSSSSSSPNSELVFFQGIARFLSENKETKRMFRRQSKQFDTFQPEVQCTMLGMLSSAGLNEFNELFPDEDAVSLSTQLKETMNVLYDQFQREHFQLEAAAKMSKARVTATSAATAANASGSGNVAAAINVQRKIDTSAILLDESVLPVVMKERDELVDLNIRQKRRQHVILCATLVDKVPNLAGLARTCEIFNAHKLVVPNLRVCDDEVFQTISVTANKWVPMEEVREDGLVAALTQWKSDGYTIVAVEQTASSQCLSKYQFPEKIVIVLGKEKEGIPVDVLQMVDVCVEIPQFGLIRSLNVHVSGAILLWEYTQQRLVSGGSSD